ncbi:MAG: CoA synthetase [Alphaproteobacteria bacterium]|nr:CoA synthetase [Alphaproteobacteria bacterium]
MSSDFALVSVDELVARIPDGAVLAMPPDYSLSPAAAVRALIRRGAARLSLLGVPISGYCADLLIGAGAVGAITTSAVSLGEYGLAPRFTAAVKAGTIKVDDATCPCVHTALQAAEKGVPFMPLRGVIGSDLLRHRPDWKVVDNPFGNDDPILLVPAISPDYALFHAPMVDRAGNVWVGRRREVATLAHAARTVLVTAERLYDGTMLEDERLAPGCIGAVYINAAALAPKGAWPLGCLDLYDPDEAHLALYARAARDETGFRGYLDAHVLGAA